MAKACFSNLFATAINANLARFPLATILSNKALQALLYLYAEKAAKNTRFLNFLLPTLVILRRPRTLLPDS